MAQTMISIRMDENLKKDMEFICQELGLNMTTAVNIFLRQVIRVNGIPFEIKGSIPKQETIEAMEESIAIANGKEKGYTNIDDLKKALEV
jgi:DNA-damage-inducible protein J